MFDNLKKKMFDEEEDQNQFDSVIGFFIVFVVFVVFVFVVPW